MKGDAEKAISTYLKEVSAALARGDASEHTYRPALQTLVEALNQGITCTNEPRHVTDAGHPLLRPSTGDAGRVPREKRYSLGNPRRRPGPTYEESQRKPR